MHVKRRIIPVFLPHQGCPHDCIFCNQEHISGRKRSAPGPEEIRRIISEQLEARHEGELPAQIAFYGGSFTCLPESMQYHCMELAGAWIASGEVESIRCSTRPDCINEENLKRLAELGLRTVEVGVQSMDNRVLRLSRRGHDADCTRRAVKLLHDMDFEVGIQLMVGLPGDSSVKFVESVRQALELKPDFIRLYPTLVVEDSGLVEPWLLGEYRALNLDEAVKRCAFALTICEEAGVPVIRMGLQATEELQGKILAGPWHPAFRSLVESYRWLLILKKVMEEIPPPCQLELKVSHRDISAVLGDKRCNLRELDAMGHAGRYTIKADRSVKRGTLHALYKRT